MNEKKAREFKKELACGPLAECFFCQAKGYLEAIEKAKVLKDALVLFSYESYEAKKALAKWEKTK